MYLCAEKMAYMLGYIIENLRILRAAKRLQKNMMIAEICKAVPEAKKLTLREVYRVAAKTDDARMGWRIR